MLPTENPWPAMIALVCVAILCLIQWGARRRLVHLIVGVLCLFLSAGCYVLDIYVQTPREVITENVYGLTSAFQKQDAPKTLSYFAPQAKERVIIENLLDGVHV